MRWITTAVTALLVGASLSGCGAGGEDDAARDAAQRFERALSGDARGACALLAPGTREALEKEAGQACAASLPGEKLTASTDLGEVHVAGHSAQVKAGEDTLFLALFDDGWHVTAAGCERQGDDPEIPYDCQLKGD